MTNPNPIARTYRILLVMMCNKRFAEYKEVTDFLKFYPDMTDSDKSRVVKLLSCGRWVSCRLGHDECVQLADHLYDQIFGHGRMPDKARAAFNKVFVSRKRRRV